MIVVNGYTLDNSFKFEELKFVTTPLIFRGSKFFVKTDKKESTLVLSGYIKGNSWADVEDMLEEMRNNIFDVQGKIEINLHGYRYYGFPVSFIVRDLKPFIKDIKIKYSLVCERHHLFANVEDDVFPIPSEEPEGM